MPTPLKSASTELASERTFEITRKEPEVHYWKLIEKNDAQNLEKTNVPRKYRRLINGLVIPVKEMFSIDWIPVDIHVDPADIASALQAQEDIDQKALEYWGELSACLRKQSERFYRHEEPWVTFNASAGLLYCATKEE